MRRADRISQIIHILRRRSLTTAKHLSEHLEVSERTIYRDIADLIEDGVPIEGEAGVGYRMGKNFELPPLMFNLEEVEALALGMRMVQKWADRDLARSARNIMEKVEGVLPESERLKLESTALFAFSFRITDHVKKTMRNCRKGINERRVLAVDYLDPEGNKTTRKVIPLGLFFWGQTWTLGAYCTLREGFRNFRLDRVQRLRLTREIFELTAPITLDDYIREQRRVHAHSEKTPYDQRETRKGTN